MNSPGQLPALIGAALSAVLDVLVAYGVIGKGAAAPLETALTALIALGIYLYSHQGHQMAIERMKLQAIQMQPLKAETLPADPRTRA